MDGISYIFNQLDYGMSNLNLARDFNSNQGGLSGIIAKLANFDEILNGLRQVMNDQIRGVTDTKSKKDDLDTNITRELDKIKHELFDKLSRMFDDLRNHQMNQKAQSLKLQQEISILKKEKLDLYQKTTDLQRRIADMENTIGHDYKN